MSEPLEHIGGLLCLDFANTVGPRRDRADKNSHDHLADFPSLVDWSTDAGTIGANRAELLRKRGQRDPEAARTTLSRAKELREAIYAVFVAIAQGDEPPGPALTHLQQAYAEAMRRAGLVSTPNGLNWNWSPKGELDCVLWPIAHSAVETAINADFSRIKECLGHDGSCGWLFHDTSKNGARRWCSMSACGTWEKTSRRGSPARKA
ncbi:ABATE domain-containing protein [Amycolatopsis sp. QT-25]|uniref:CGNR zinc finger domain-containing protein n=1 Tax=Amycolatopsis sp. QT-25 TaxID=3034022 RepID=UPI0023ECBE91|nr:ABATE domain-containing protein [Amycolatopsis sp. QT-25]WET81025.1 ABATE domain-containing protein [Amycolatopsis sp. QT-25]